MTCRRLSTAALVAGCLAASTDGPRAITPAQSAPLEQRIAAYIQAHAAEFIAIRHDIHRHPEVSGAEVRTAQVVADRLRASGLEVRTGIGGHGVVGIVTGGRPGPLVAYRADMDAVPSADPDPVEYRSLTPGVRHQCGHDLHVATGLALAAAFASVRADLSGSVMFVFQPAEERATGAKAMLAAGVFSSARPVAIYGVHSAPFEVGQVGVRPGVMMAARDMVRITIAGTGDTQAAAREARSAIMATSTLAPSQALQSQPEGFVMAQIGPATPRAEGGLTMQAGLTLAGHAARARAKEQVARGLAAIAVPNVTLAHEYLDGFVAGVTNDATLTEAAARAIAASLGASAVQPVTGIIPAFSEDFGSFQAEVPGVFFFLGVANAARNIAGMPHAPGFVADDDAIAVGARAMAAVLLDRLRR